MKYSEFKELVCEELDSDVLPIASLYILGLCRASCPKSIGERHIVQDGTTNESYEYDQRLDMARIVRLELEWEEHFKARGGQ